MLSHEKPHESFSCTNNKQLHGWLSGFLGDELKRCQRKQVQEEEIEKHFKFKRREPITKARKTTAKEIVPQKRSSGQS